MWAIIHRVQARTLLAKLHDHLFVYLTNQIFGKIAATYSRLVGHYYHREFRPVQTANRRGRTRQQLEPADMIQIADLCGNRAITVQKHGGT
jgi:hypothetical protein